MKGWKERKGRMEGKKGRKKGKKIESQLLYIPIIFVCHCEHKGKDGMKEKKGWNERKEGKERKEWNERKNWK